MSDLKKVAFLCQPYHRGGVTAWMAIAAKEFAKQGVVTFFVTVNPVKPFISSGNKPTMIELLGDHVPNLKIVSQKVGAEFELGTESYRSYVYANLIQKYVPEGTAIILSDDSSVWLSGAIVAKQYSIIGVIHSSIDPGYFQLTKKYYPYLSQVVCVSTRTKHNLLTQVPLLNIPTHVIPCGINIGEFNHHNTNPMVNTNALRIAWIGRLEEFSKRVSDIPKIVLLLLKQDIEFSLTVIGDGEEFGKLKQDIQNHKLQKHIQLLGWKTGQEIAAILSKSDLLLQTSNYEGMSVSVMEALASSCGVVSSRVSGVEDYEDYTCAKHSLRLYEVGDVNDAVAKIIELSNINSQDRNASALQFAQDVFSIEACVHQYINIIKESSPSCLKIESPVNNGIVVMKSYALFLIRKIKYELFRRVYKK